MPAFASAYSYNRHRTIRKPRASKLCAQDVTDIRRWASREGYGLSLVEQARALHAKWYPTLSVYTLTDILANRSWHDPAYDRLTPHPDFGVVSPALVLLLLFRRVMSAQVNASKSPLEVHVDDDVRLAQGADRVLDGAPIEPGLLGQALDGADIRPTQG